MKGSAFVWFIGMIGFIVFGLVWIGIGEASNRIIAIGDSVITNTTTLTTYTLMKSIINYMPLIVLLFIIVFMLINSQKTEGVFG